MCIFVLTNFVKSKKTTKSVDVKGDGMVKIKVSYEHRRELQRVLEKLGDDVKKIKKPKEQEGRYKKAYIEINK